MFTHTHTYSQTWHFWNLNIPCQLLLILFWLCEMQCRRALNWKVLISCAGRKWRIKRFSWYSAPSATCEKRLEQDHRVRRARDEEGAAKEHARVGGGLRNVTTLSGDQYLTHRRSFCQGEESACPLQHPVWFRGQTRESKSAFPAIKPHKNMTYYVTC